MKHVAMSVWAVAGALAATVAQAYPTAVLGTPVPVSAASRTVVLTPETRSVDVAYGESVTFDINGQRFAWQFATPARSFDLNQVASVPLSQSVRVYVGPDERNNE